MNRTYIICHILSALDGKITGKFMDTESARTLSEEYARIRTAFHADAWLYGTVTTKEFTGYKNPKRESVTDDIAEGDFVAEKDAALYYISVDTKGEIGWESGTFRKAGRPDAHVIEILTEDTPATYMAYLRRHGVSYILAGKEKLDCKIAAEKLYCLFGIETMLICGGGTVNWTFLQQGVMDELSLLIAPTADGSPTSVTVFEESDYLPPAAPAEFQLKEVERLKGDGIRLTYLVRKKD
jgi:riboflavin biosynthesis pyrimidine reductase